MKTDKDMLSAFKSTRGTLRAFWRLASPYWFSEERWVARGLLSVVVALTLCGVYLMVLLNAFYREFFDAIQKLDEKAFWSLIMRFCGLITAAILVWVSREYFTQTLQNHWRRALTRRLIERWLWNKSHSLAHLSESVTDNPECAKRSIARRCVGR